ncbi:putative leucine-rich repeat domain superfamily, winged helix-like DNA-binding domain superfamily [Dioscorea sansibarensis]
MAIPAKMLIRLWSAEGFLPTKDGKTIEEVGMDCLEELAQRCMMQVTKRKYDDSASYCRIHDLLHDLCVSEAKENRYFEIYKNDSANCGTKSNAARRLMICHEIENLSYSNSKLRGLFYYNEYIYNTMAFKALKEQFSGFKLLRVLYLRSLDMSEFPSEIKSLIHLRYLELHADDLKEVPSWIGHLRNLQTFIVGCRMFIGKISDSLWTIDSLKHVDLGISSSVPAPHMGNIELKNLETLKWVPAGEWIGNMLPKLTNLHKLNITNISADHADALSSSLQKFVQLASLTIQGDKIPSDNIIAAFSNQRCLRKLYIWGEFKCKQLPRNNVFPQQLMKLILINSLLEQDPMATLEKLEFLKYLSLGNQSYRGKQMICSATGFPQLLSLTIVGFYELEVWTIEEKAMPCLKYLHIAYCSELKVIPEGLKNVPLDQLVLRSMTEDLIIRIKEKTGVDWSKIQHVPDISIRP